MIDRVEWQKKQAKIAEIQSEQEKQQKAESDKRFIEERKALSRVGVSCKILDIIVELKFTFKSYSWLENNGFHEASQKQQGVMFMKAAMLHDNRIDFDKIEIPQTEELLEALKQAWEQSQPLEPLTPIDEETQKRYRRKSKPPGFELDYAEKQLFIMGTFNRSSEEFWEMTPRELCILLDKYNYQQWEQSEAEKRAIAKNKKR